MASASSAGPRQKSTGFLSEARRLAGLFSHRYLFQKCQSGPGIPKECRRSFQRLSIAAGQPPGGTLRTKTGQRSFRTSGTFNTPSSPMMVSDLSFGATRLQVIRATTPLPYSMQPTVKSGAKDSTAIPLSGTRHDANEVTLSAGPKNAANQVKIYPACS